MRFADYFGLDDIEGNRTILGYRDDIHDRIATCRELMPYLPNFMTNKMGKVIEVLVCTAQLLEDMYEDYKAETTEYGLGLPRERQVDDPMED